MPNGKSGSRRTAAALLLLAAVLVSARSPGATAGEQGEGREAPPFEAVRDPIRAAFARGDADRLRPVLSRRTKTYVSLEETGAPDGYYGADQLILLFRRMFAGLTTVRLSFGDPAEGPRPDGQAALTAQWIHRRDTGGRSETRLAFILALEAGAWRIREIRGLK